MNARTKLEALPALETAEIPTLIFGARTHLPHAVALIIRLGDQAEKCRAWLTQIQPDITYGHDRLGQAVVLGFTATGLRKLGLPDDDLAAFSTAFQSGMTGPGRPRVLGDEDGNAPEHWDWGYRDKHCDAILLLYAKTGEELDSRKAGRIATLKAYDCMTLRDIALQKRQRRRVALTGGERHEATDHGATSAPEVTTEPFGFADGLSQPFIRGTPRARDRAPHEVTPAGAFILGYEALSNNAVPNTPLIPRDRDPDAILPVVTGEDGLTRADFGRNGTFLVVRQLEQDVEAFETFTAKAAGYLKQAFFDQDDTRLMPAVPEGLLQEWVAAKLLGRWRDGSSMVRHPAAPGTTPDNHFFYRAEDPLGRFCPLGAHIRRANPRDSLTSDPAVSQDIAGRHRLLRVGRPYAPKKHQQPGILFMCLNADIELQFETVQQSWLNRTDFHGLRNESDPITGCDAAPRAYTIPTNLGPARLTGLQNFVKVVGGAYVFLPSRAAIRYLAGLKRPGSALEPLTVT